MLLDVKHVVHADMIFLCTICKRYCRVSQRIPLREMREVHTAVFLKFWLCAGTGTPRHVGLIRQRNLTQSWARCRFYMTCYVLNSLLIKYSNIIQVQFWGGVGGACSMNEVEYTYVQEWENSKDSHSSCQGSDTERFIMFSQS